MSIEAISPISPVLAEHTPPGGTGQHEAPGTDHQVLHPAPHKPARPSGPLDGAIDPVPLVDRTA